MTTTHRGRVTTGVPQPPAPCEAVGMNTTCTAPGCHRKRERLRTKCTTCRKSAAWLARSRVRRKNLAATLRDKVFAAYGGPVCKCCGERAGGEGDPNRHVRLTTPLPAARPVDTLEALNRLWRGRAIPC